MLKIKKSSKWNKLNKKGFIEDFGSLVLAGILIFIFGFILVVLLNSDIEEKKAVIAQGLSELEGEHSTRVLLNYELAPGYTLSEFIVDKINQEKYDEIKPKISEVLRIYYGGKNTGDWFFKIKYGESIYNFKTITGKTEDSSSKPTPFAAVMHLPPAAIIPNEQGSDIEILIKKTKPEDYDYVPNKN